MPQTGHTYGAANSWNQQDQVDVFATLDWEPNTTSFDDGGSSDPSPVNDSGGQPFFDAFSAPDYQAIAPSARAVGSTASHGNTSHHHHEIVEGGNKNTSPIRYSANPVTSYSRDAALTKPSPKQKRTVPHDFEVFLPLQTADTQASTGIPQQQYQGPEAGLSSRESPLQNATPRPAQHTYTQTSRPNSNPGARGPNNPATEAGTYNRPKPQFKSPPAPPRPQKQREYNKRRPLARQMYSNHNTFQPNDEEEVRRKHFGHMSNRDESVDSSTSLQSRGAHDYTRSDNAEDDAQFGVSREEADMGHGPVPGVMRSSDNGDQEPDVANGTLPAGKGFLIQVGSETFKLSGASIMSDAPSYFSNFFSNQLMQNGGEGGTTRTLFLDRDPETFRDICRHLQGYVIQPRDAGHFVRLFADAQLFSLPRLISLLFDSETFISIGGENFILPRDIFSGIENTPNYFSLGFAVFFSSPDGPFPGLDARSLLRPPPVKPPNVPGRSARVFADILHLLRGYNLTIRDENHRAELLRDCRYFNLRGLEQRIILHHISYNASRGCSEILIRLEDIRQSGISFVEEISPSSSSPLSGWVHYARPLIDDTSHELIIEIDDETAKIDFRSMRVDFYDQTKARISKLFQVIANKMNLPVTAPLGLMMATGGVAAQEVSPGNTPLSEDRVKIKLGPDAHIVLDGEDYISDASVAEPRAQFEEDDGHESTNSPMVDRNPMISAPTSATTTTAPSNWPTINLTPSQPRTSSPASTLPPSRKRRRRGSLDDFGEWMVKRGQWRLRVRPRSDSFRTDARDGHGSINDKMEIVLHAVKIEAFSGQRGRNMQRGFLS